MPYIRRASVLLAAFSLAACDGLFEPGEPAQEQILFLRYTDPSRANMPVDSADIYRMNADGTGVQNLTGHPAFYASMAPSPDGRRVVFQSSRGNQVDQVWTMNSDGTGLRQISTGNAWQPRWSPDGARIAMMMAPGGDGAHVYVMNVDGSNPVKVSMPAMQVGSSCGNSGAITRIDLVGWIPGGRIAFTRHYCGFGYRYFIVNADGSGFTETSIKLYEAFWSPDGSRVVYPKFEGTFWRVMLANGDGSGERVLTTQGTHQGLPWSSYTPWSPDGEQIVFFADTVEVAASPRECFASAQAYVVNVDGSGVKKLMEGCRGFFNGWSRSGEQMAFTIYPGTGRLPDYVPDLHVVNADGTGAANITNSPFWESDARWLGRR